MQESAVRAEVYRLLRTAGLWPITQTDAFVCSRCKTVNRPPKGRPDILVLNPEGRSYVVEVKVIRDGSFPMDDLRPEQRRWLQRWSDAGGLGFIAIGTTKRPRHLWLIPWAIWQEIEAQEQNRKRKSVSALTVAAIASEYELTRVSGGWLLPQKLQELLGIQQE